MWIRKFTLPSAHGYVYENQMIIFSNYFDAVTIRGTI